ncbi:MAG: hypothetical protein IPM82_29670 [Saprospiraceae bacterium]|nr:hypothetical protein [Saprospiraceae bacterium]
MRNVLRKAIPFIVIGLFLLMAAILPELLGGDIKTWCETNLGRYWWALLILIFLLLFALAAKYNPGILGGLFPSNNNDKSTPNPEDNTHFYPKIKEYLKTRYQSRLDQKLANRQPVNLRRLPSFYGTSDETTITYVPYGPGEIQEEMAQTFREAKGRLLLIGAPGAGKTSLLLQLVLDLLKTEQDVLPAIINLATWTKDYANLDTWLREILPAELSVNKAPRSNLAG